ncbi:MAG: hypothetical protein IJM23_05695 [Lachnospiraceae bacterium]|nr:hypothetical protein [Lachnospiraceae bacterium]
MNGIDTFSDALIADISKRCKKELGEDCTVISQEVDKLNGVKLHGITVSRGDSSISPVIYAENYIDMFEDGKQMDYIIDSVMEIFKRHFETKPDIDSSMFSDWNCVKDKIGARLINYEANKDMLKETPYIRFLDLAVIFDIKGSHTSLGSCSVRITNHLMDFWGISLTDLETAFNENLSKMEVDIKPLSELIGKFLTGDSGCGNDLICPLCVMSTNEAYGAIAMLRKDVIKAFTERIGRDVYIIPSSVHELLLYPANENAMVPEINSMINEVNRNVLNPMDVLSDHAYFYSRELDDISIVA